MAAIEVGAAAEVNEAKHSAHATALIDADSSGDRLNLARLVDGAMPSTNAFAWKIGYFNANGLISTRALATAKCGGDAAAGLSLYISEQEEYFVRREAFEEIWVDGRSFVYLAANPGHNGIEKYGDFCLVINPNRLINKHSAIFPENSLHAYTDAVGNLDYARALGEVGPWRSRSDVAVVKHEADVPGRPEGDLPTFICREECFVEVVTVGPIDVDHVIELRLSTRDAASLSALAAMHRKRRLSKRDEIEMAKAFIAVRSWPNVQLSIG